MVMAMLWEPEQKRTRRELKRGIENALADPGFSKSPITKNCSSSRRDSSCHAPQPSLSIFLTQLTHSKTHSCATQKCVCINQLYLKNKRGGGKESAGSKELNGNPLALVTVPLQPFTCFPRRAKPEPSWWQLNMLCPFIDIYIFPCRIPSNYYKEWICRKEGLC